MNEIRNTLLHYQVNKLFPICQYVLYISEFEYKIFIHLEQIVPFAVFKIELFIFSTIEAKYSKGTFKHISLNKHEILFFRMSI